MARADPLQQLVVAGALIPRIAVALEALQQAAKHESLDQLVAVVIAGLEALWRVAGLALRLSFQMLRTTRAWGSSSQVEAVESFHRFIAIGVGRVQLAEGMQQQFVDVGSLLGQHSEHLELHGGLVVVGAQQLIELGVAHRMRLVVAGEAGIRGVGAEAG